MAENKVAFYTLGCKLNFSESSTLIREFINRGYQKVHFNDKADVYVINTCTVTEIADKKCRYFIKKAIQNSPDAKVFVIGCYSQLDPESIAKIKGVDLIIGANEKYKLFQYLDDFQKADRTIIDSESILPHHEFFPSYSLNERTRSFLKIQDGCDCHCSYCTVPLARGESRNAPISEIVRMVKLIAVEGVKEIVLTGVNIGDFGKSTGESFIQLIKILDKIEGVHRYRISSIEPELLTDEIIEFINGSEKFVPHFHIPLQTGSDKILALMKRRYTRELFSEHTKKIKSGNQDACIGVDIIAGFPGESEKDFDETYNFLKEMDISYMHVFTFSERRNTPATFMIGKIDKSEKEKRSKKLINLSGEKRNLFYFHNLNKIAEVIFESQNHNEKMLGFTGNYIKTESHYSPELINKIVKCKMTGVNANGSMNVELMTDFI